MLCSPGASHLYVYFQMKSFVAHCVFFLLCLAFLLGTLSDSTGIFYCDILLLEEFEGEQIAPFFLCPLYCGLSFQAFIPIVRGLSGKHHNYIFCICCLFFCWHFNGQSHTAAIEGTSSLCRKKKIAGFLE